MTLVILLLIHFVVSQAGEYTTIINKIASFDLNSARDNLKEILSKKPNDNVANELMGIIYCYSGTLQKAIPFLEKSISLKGDEWQPYHFLGVAYKFHSRTLKTAKERTDYLNKAVDTLDKCHKLLTKGKTKTEKDKLAKSDSFMYYHFGEALNWLNQPEKALEIHEYGVTKGYWKDPYQRVVLDLVPGITAKPWYEKTDFPYYEKYFRKHFDDILTELKTIKNNKNIWSLENEGLHDEATWYEYQIFGNGVKSEDNCKKVPKTCSAIEKITEAAKLKMGYTKFSLMSPGTKVKPHCGTTNSRLRLHLGMIIPSGPKIRVGKETREWKEGEIIVFDDSFEHEVWHNGDKERIVLIMDFLHPELLNDEGIKKYLNNPTKEEIVKLKQKGDKWKSSLKEEL